MGNILDIAQRDGYSYAEKFVLTTFSSYREAKRWAKLTISKEREFKLAEEDMKKYGYCFDWCGKEDKIPFWWSSGRNKVNMLTSYYRGKFDFCHRLLRGELTLQFTRR
jgi:hypothetical protein